MVEIRRYRHTPVIGSVGDRVDILPPEVLPVLEPKYRKKVNLKVVNYVTARVFPVRL